MKWKLVEVFSAQLLHVLVITTIKTMVMFNNSPKGSKDCGSNWLRKKKFSVQSSGTSRFCNSLENDAPKILSSQSEIVWGFQKVYMQCTARDRGQNSADVSITGCFVGDAKIASASSCI